MYKDQNEDLLKEKNGCSHSVWTAPAPIGLRGSFNKLTKKLVNSAQFVNLAIEFILIKDI